MSLYFFLLLFNRLDERTRERNVVWLADVVPSLLPARAYIGSGGTLVPEKERERQKVKKLVLTCWHLFREDVRTLGGRAYIRSEQFPQESGRR